VKAAGNFIERIRNHRARVHVVAASDGVAHAVCSCKKLRAAERTELNAAADDAFRHHCETRHRMAAPWVQTVQS
jgi:hypothetical protein